MKLLLINKNPVVSRMMLMSVPKAGFEIEECESVYDLPSGRYEVVVIDDEMYDENFLHDIKQNVKFAKLGLITASKSTDKEGFDFILTKPFLPTDLIEILREVKNELEQSGGLPEPEPKEEESSAFEKFMASDEEIEQNYLKEFEPKIEPSELEKIVEVEEKEEESPFVQEELGKSGVLNEEEVEKVSQLLEETQEEPIVPLASSEPELKEEPEPMPEPEPTPESILTSLVSEERINEPEEFVAPVSEPKIEEPAAQEEQKVEHVAKEVAQNINASMLRELLDGMQLDITIKISFPDKR